jgi:curli biogenesis system outer membrane secretion channel CsgG
MTVVLFPLDRKGPGDGGGALLEDMLLGSLLERRRFEMVERERLEALLREARLSRSDLADPSTAVRLGRILAAEAVLIGSILQKEGSLDIFVRLVDTETTLILAAVDVYGEDVDSRLMRKLCRGLVLKLCD